MILNINFVNPFWEVRVERPLNCWEYMLCGREPGGFAVRKFGACPAATDARFDGVHRGKNAGRTCWTVAGSVRKEEIHCQFAAKAKNCGACDFYEIVRKEEGDKLLPTIFLIQILEEHTRET